MRRTNRADWIESVLRTAPFQRLIRIRNRFRERLREQRLVSHFLDGRGELRRLRRDFHESGLLEELERSEREFGTKVEGETERGNRYAMGGDVQKSIYLYYLCRKLRPEVAVETGVCNGFSSALILLALEHNGAGHLYSIDFPEEAGRSYDAGTFWNGKEGSVIPPDATPGWIVPQRLRRAWTLVLGRTQDELVPLLDRLGTVDLFVHDSEHSYECMTFEFEEAFRRLREHGVLAADDIDWNDAFDDFARRVGRRPIRLTAAFGVMRK